MWLGYPACPIAKIVELCRYFGPLEYCQPASSALFSFFNMHTNLQLHCFWTVWFHFLFRTRFSSIVEVSTWQMSRTISNSEFLQPSRSKIASFGQDIVSFSCCYKYYSIFYLRSTITLMLYLFLVAPMP